MGIVKQKLKNVIIYWNDLAKDTDRLLLRSYIQIQQTRHIMINISHKKKPYKCRSECIYFQITQACLCNSMEIHTFVTYIALLW